MFYYFTPLGSVFLLMAPYINNKYYWRFVFRYVENPLILFLNIKYIKLLYKLAGIDLLNIFFDFFVYAKWPKGYNYINQHLLNLHQKMSRSVVKPTGSIPARSASRQNSKIKVGFIGKISGLLGFHETLFENCPDEIDTYIFDIEYRGSYATKLQNSGCKYRQISRNITGSKLGDIINSSKLDILISACGTESYSFIDYIDSPCIAIFCAGSSLLYHDKISFQFFTQPQANYFIDGHYLFSGFTRTHLLEQPIFSGYFPYDPRGVEKARITPWREREKILSFHGSLYKIANHKYLKTVFEIMEEDASLNMLIMGKPSRGVTIDTILCEAKKPDWHPG